MMRTVVVVLLLALGISVQPVSAVNPDEMLDDPKLEERARDLSEGLRCLVCQNQSIDKSNADMAKDLRVLVRERIKAGDSDDEVLDYVTDRYGAFVLLKPPFSAGTLMLWALPFVVMAIGIGASLMYLRSRRGVTTAESGLSTEERSEIAKIMRDRRGS